MKKKITAHLEPDLQGLLNGQLDNRQKDIKTITNSIKKADFEKIRMLAHFMRGSGGDYDLMSISKVDESLDETARFKDLNQIKKHLVELSDFLEQVTLVYV